MGTSNSCKSMCSKLLLDHAGEWHRTAKSIQAHQNHVKDCVEENSLENISPNPVQSTLPRLDLPQAPFDSNQKTGRKLQNHYIEMELHHWRYLRNMRKVHLTLQDLESQQERTLGSQPAHLVTFTCKDTIASVSVEYQLKKC